MDDGFDREQMGREKGYQNESVLGVLVHAKKLHPRPPRRALAGKMIDVSRALLEAAFHPRRSPDRDSAGRLLPHGKIGRIVADVVEAAFAECLHELLRLDDS